MTRSVLLVRDDIDDVRIAVINAVDEPLVDMTVESICKKAGISKQTFYSRFSSKFDIANWLCRRYETMFLYEIGRTLSWEDGLSSLFSGYEQWRDFLYLSSVRSLDDGTETKSRHREVLKETLVHYRGVPLNRDAAFLIEAYLEVEIFLVGEWFRSRMIPDAAEFARLFIDCIPRRFYELLQTQTVTCDDLAGEPTVPFGRYYPGISS
jgi:AcrR family transcriptional regulator